MSGGKLLASYRAPADPKLARFHPTAVACWLALAPTLDEHTARHLVEIYEIDAAATVGLDELRRRIAARLRSAKLWQVEEAPPSNVAAPALQGLSVEESR